ncbi:uncharacterized protein LOC119459569 [Dermacentor silvarum]|uniref:uncharacterized protein LOC119459569 n=1 Tax=Dermacentor silvarum TaxID=543639 RepID=UPI001898BC4C|nr:uncharacterized protein LOC119459569 [Dermacentor silvarum]
MASCRGYCFLILLATPLLGTCLLQLNAGCKVETLHACGQDYIPYITSPRLQESGNEFDEECKKDKVQIPCNLNFINNCTDGVSRAAALVAVQALEEHIEAICNVGSDSYTEYQRDVKCLNAHGEKIISASRASTIIWNALLSRVQPMKLFTMRAARNTTRWTAQATPWRHARPSGPRIS